MCGVCGVCVCECARACVCVCVCVFVCVSICMPVNYYAHVSVSAYCNFCFQLLCVLLGVILTYQIWKE